MSEPVHDKDTAQSSAPKPVVVKKYANRRLYNTESSSYITLENLADMVRQGRDFVVYDAKTNEDITRAVLTQIIVEEEGKGGAMLPTSFLRQLIGMYGEDMQSLVPRYLEQAMAAFTRQQEQVQATVRQTMGNLMPPGLTGGMPTGLEEVGRQNLAMMERAMSLFSPFYRPTSQEAAAAEAPAGAAAPATPSPDDLAILRAEVIRLREELAAERAKVAKPGKPRGGG
jgi:polyhydroxyalkanoate synthesis repressor PhaR